MRQSPTPVLISMVLCRDVVEDPVSAELDFLEVFHTLRIPQFPFCLPVLRVYLQLSDAQGTLASRLLCVRTSDDKPIFGSAIHSVHFHSRIEQTQTLFCDP